MHLNRSFLQWLHERHKDFSICGLEADLFGSDAEQAFNLYCEWTVDNQAEIAHFVQCKVRELKK